MNQSYIVDVQPKELEQKVRLYTSSIPESERDEIFRGLRLIFESDERSPFSGLRSIPTTAFFSSYPPSNELRKSFVPSPEEFGEEYDPTKIEALEQALYIHLVGDSIAMPIHTFKVVGQEAVASLLEERNATPEDLSGLLENPYVVFTDYSKSGGLVVGLRAK